MIDDMNDITTEWTDLNGRFEQWAAKDGTTEDLLFLAYHANRFNTICSEALEKTGQVVVADIEERADEKLDLAYRMADELATVGGPSARDAFRHVQQNAPEHITTFVLHSIGLVDMHPCQISTSSHKSLEDAFVAAWDEVA